MKNQRKRPKRWAEVATTFKKEKCEDDWRTPFAFFQWCCLWALFWLGEIALLDVLERLGKLSILFAVIVWLFEIPQRRQAAENSIKNKHYIAWQTINSAVGKPGNAGRSDALRDLNDDGVELSGISLSGGVVLDGTRLANAHLEHADLSDGHYENVDFSGARFYQSSWNGATCEDCDFRGAQFKSVCFSNVTFVGCNFAGADFDSSIWVGTTFDWCNFAFADFSSIRIGDNVHELGGNLFGAANAPAKFVIWASEQTFLFTNVVTLTGWRHAVRPPKLRPYPAIWSPIFQNWASNQFIYNPEGRLEWSTNLNNH